MASLDDVTAAAAAYGKTISDNANAQIISLQNQLATATADDATDTATIASLNAQIIDLKAKLAAATGAPPVVIPPVDPPVTPPVDTTPISSLPKIPWHGGPAYYSKFAKANASQWVDPNFFPISVFFGKPSHVDQLKAVGVNTYMGAEHDGSPISMITDKGTYVLAQTEWSSSEIGSDPKVVGWHSSDEIEMNESYGNDAGRIAANTKNSASIRAKNDGRFVQANFGNGVLETYWASGTMPKYITQVDLSSVDKYAYTSPAVDFELNRSPFSATKKNAASAGAYGWLQDQMEKFASPAGSKPNWVFVETAKPFLTESGAKVITPDQIEGAVWSSIIHGASGIAYFQHSNDGTGTYSLITGPQANRDRVKMVNAQVQKLASVLNTQSYAWNFGAGLETMLKTSAGAVYIFAMTDGSAGSKAFTLPGGLTGSVTVVDENRTIPIVGGKFTDSFAAEFTKHIYKIG